MNRIAFAAVSFVLLSAGTSTHLSNISSPVATPVGHKAVAVAMAAPTAPTAPTPVMVAVQSGDTLTSIADVHGTTYDRIFDANDALADPNVITPGQQLRIPTGDEQLPDRMATVTPTPAAVAAAPATARKATYAAASYPVSGNDAKAFIYSHESGNNPYATSPNGCYGLGQDCNGRVRALCGADYACQDQYFTNYAMGRYGSWEGAVAFWQANHWW